MIMYHWKRFKAALLMKKNVRDVPRCCRLWASFGGGAEEVAK